MAQIGFLGNQGESLINIFPNPCIGDTYLYTDDLEAAFVDIVDEWGNIQHQAPIEAGKTLHILLSLLPGTYQLVLKDPYQNILGLPKSLYITTSH